jgi:hypothetical protein
MLRIDLRFHVRDRALSTELTPITVNFTVPKDKGHTPAPGGIQIFSSKPRELLQDSRRPVAALSPPCPRRGNLRVGTCSGPLDAGPASVRRWRCPPRRRQ